MQELTKQLYFQDKDTTSLRELKELANLLLNVTWNITNVRRYEPNQDINLAKLGWTFEFNQRKRALGLCSSRNKKIYLSEWLCRQNFENAKKLEDTIRHEIAHAIDYTQRRTSDHSRRWVAVALQVLSNGERCYTEKDIQVKVKTKYTLTCPNCEKEMPSHKVKRSKSACRNCCNEHNYGRYSEKYVLIQTQNY